MTEKMFLGMTTNVFSGDQVYTTHYAHNKLSDILITAVKINTGVSRVEITPRFEEKKVTAVSEKSSNPPGKSEFPLAGKVVTEQGIVITLGTSRPSFVQEGPI